MTEDGLLPLLAFAAIPIVFGPLFAVWVGMRSVERSRETRLMRTRPRVSRRDVALSFDLSRARFEHARRTGESLARVGQVDTAFRKWFVVAAASPVMIGMGSRVVDEFWHTLLEVDGGSLYREFSQAVADREIMHVEGVGSEDLDARAWIAYEAVWGSPPSSEFFPVPSDAALQRYRATSSSSSGSDGGGGDMVSLTMAGPGCGSSSGSTSGCDASGGDAGGSGGDGGGGDGGGSGCGGGGCGGA